MTRISGAVFSILALLLLAGSALAKAISDRPVDADDRSTQQMVVQGLFFGETGEWRTRTELMFDPVTKHLTRRSFTIWDPMPSKHLQFVWTPEDASRSVDGIVSGRGRLVWRLADKPAYDASAVVAVYRGDLRNGRPEGLGEYREANGVWYEGVWRAGLSQGQGHLRYPNGDEYQGEFANGVPNGQGRYIDSTGEAFAGRFANGKREGSGTTTLPNGKTYASKWGMGVELGQSRQARVAAAGAAGVPEEIRIGIQVNPALHSYVEEAGEGRLKPAGKDWQDDIDAYVTGFKASSEPNALNILPNRTRLMSMWKGNGGIALTKDEEHIDEGFPGYSYGVFSRPQDMFPPLDLTVEVQNRTAAQIQIVGAYIDVSTSATDLQPALQVTRLPDSLKMVEDLESCGTNVEGLPNPNDGSSLIAHIQNFGWAPARNVELRYAVGQRQVTHQIPDVAKSVGVSFASDLKTSGVAAGPTIRQRIKAIVSASSRQAYNNKGELQQSWVDAIRSGIRQSGVFGAISNDVTFNDDDSIGLTLAGEVAYEWTGVSGEPKRRSSPVEFHLVLAEIEIPPPPGSGSPAAECGEGSTPEVVTTGRLKFRNDVRAYRLTFPLRRSIPAGRSARYSILLDTERSSQHNFEIVLQLADGREIRSRPVNALFYRPSWAPEIGLP